MRRIEKIEGELDGSGGGDQVNQSSMKVVI